MRGLILLLIAAVASADLAPLHTQKDRIPGQYIVTLKSGHNVENVISSLGDVDVRHRYSKVFPGFAAKLTDKMVDLLRKSDAVEFIEEDSVVFAQAVESWGLDRVDQLSLPLDDTYDPIGDGSGVSVYVIDTGINKDHNDFGDRADYGFDARGDDGNDCNGHGTHCAGTVAGTLYGVAKASFVYGVRVLGCLGSGSTADVVAGCEWVAANAAFPAVASMSLGGGASATTDNAVNSMVMNGITVAVAAGNSDDDACDYSPARSVEAITVGATGITDGRASFSNYGSCVNIFAPGVGITSAWIRDPDATNTISGTSMACPHVAGAAAIVLGINNTMSPVEVGNTLYLKSIVDVVTDPQPGSPNLLLYIGEGSGGGYIPDPTDPVDPIEAGCGGVYNGTSGTFTSPNYPSAYDNGLTCDYIFSGEEGKVVTVNFEDFSLEASATCNYDEVAIYDGASTGSPSLGSFCGVDNPGYVSSTSNNMLVRFTTDSSVTATGFSGIYVIADGPAEPETGDCGHTFTQPLGMMTSPNYPDNYGNNVDCTFLIQGALGDTITLTFEDFDLESHTSCAYDAVEIYDGNMNGARIANLCDSTLPDPVTTTTNSMYIRFTSDSSVTRGGFSAKYIIG